MTITEDSQKLTQDAQVHLYEVDLTPLGNNYVVRFTRHGRPGGNVTFNGNVYTPWDVDVSGFSWDGNGAFPQPKLKLANMLGTLTSLAQTYGDFIGATFTRIRTYEKYLDDGASPDPSAIMRPDVFTIEQKTEQNKVYIEWRLSSIIEETDRLLPGRVVMRDWCPFRYRQWNATAGAFNYDHVTCPYTGTRYLDENDVATNQAGDKCGRTLNSCMKRFGSRSEIKFGGFPGVGRDRLF